MNINKFKKNHKLLSEVLKKESGESPAVFDGYDIHESIITWALCNISTKKLKEIIKKHEN